MDEKAKNTGNENKIKLYNKNKEKGERKGMREKKRKQRWRKKRIKGRKEECGK